MLSAEIYFELMIVLFFIDFYCLHTGLCLSPDCFLMSE